MIVTGISHAPARLHERTYLPSTELVYLATKALREYKAKHLVTSLSLGWEQALAKAAVELKVPFTVAIPYPGRDRVLRRDAQALYHELLSKADEVYQVSEEYDDSSMYEAHCWRVDCSDQVIALWDYEFRGDCFDVIKYALDHDRTVTNLWEDWRHLYMLRKNQTTYTSYGDRTRGAQVYP